MANNSKILSLTSYAKILALQKFLKIRLIYREIRGHGIVNYKGNQNLKHSYSATCIFTNLGKILITVGIFYELCGKFLPTVGKFYQLWENFTNCVGNPTHRGIFLFFFNFCTIKNCILVGGVTGMDGSSPPLSPPPAMLPPLSLNTVSVANNRDGSTKNNAKCKL